MEARESHQKGWDSPYSLASHTHEAIRWVQTRQTDNDHRNTCSNSPLTPTFCAARRSAAFTEQMFGASTEQAKCFAKMLEVGLKSSKNKIL